MWEEKTDVEGEKKKMFEKMMKELEEKRRRCCIKYVELKLRSDELCYFYLGQAKGIHAAQKEFEKSIEKNEYVLNISPGVYVAHESTNCADGCCRTKENVFVRAAEEESLKETVKEVFSGIKNCADRLDKADIRNLMFADYIKWAEQMINSRIESLFGGDTIVFEEEILKHTEMLAKQLKNIMREKFAELRKYICEGVPEKNISTFFDWVKC